MLEKKRRFVILAVISAGLLLLPGLTLAYSSADLEGSWEVQFIGSDSRWRMTFDASGKVTGFSHNRYETHTFSGQFQVEENGRVSGRIYREQTDATNRWFRANDHVNGAFYSSEEMEMTVMVEWAYEGGYWQHETYSSVWNKIDVGPDPIPDLINSIGMKFTLVPAGSFMMGSNLGDSDEQPVHLVEITKPFYLSMFEVTQAQWQTVMWGNNPSKFKNCDDCPVENVSWKDVSAFIIRMNNREIRDKYRLPTEAEWEYASRAGSASKWSFGDDETLLSDYAWYEINSESRTHPVGQKIPNAWGLYDMHGNVEEWCQDWYGHDYYGRSPVKDPQGISSGTFRVFRGGSWEGPTIKTSCANRDKSTTSFANRKVGFRLARNP